MVAVLWIFFFIGLFFVYTFAWFLFSALLFLLTQGKSPGITMVQAAVFGSLTAVGHIILHVTIKIYSAIGG
jgi:hypothetical protein